MLHLKGSDLLDDLPADGRKTQWISKENDGSVCWQEALVNMGEKHRGYTIGRRVYSAYLGN
jgi:hypothetical protein